MNNKCCYQCGERYVGCHAKCDKYKKYRQELDTLKQKINNEDKIVEAYKAKRRFKWQ